MSAIELCHIVVSGCVGLITSVWLTTWLLNRRRGDNVLGDTQAQAALVTVTELNRRRGDNVLGDPAIYDKLDMLYTLAWALKNVTCTNKLRVGTAIINAVGELMAENMLTPYQYRVAMNTIRQALAHM
jgi:hypothetical protein